MGWRLCVSGEGEVCGEVGLIFEKSQIGCVCIFEKSQIGGGA